MANKFLYFVDELCMSSLGSMIASKELCLEIANWVKKLSKSTIWNLPFQVLTLSIAFKLPELFAVVDTVSAFQDSDTGDIMCAQFWELFNSITSQYNRFFTMKKEANEAFDFGDPGEILNFSNYVVDATRKMLFAGILIGEAGASLLQRCSAIGSIKVTVKSDLTTRLQSILTFGRLALP